MGSIDSNVNDCWLTQTLNVGPSTDRNDAQHYHYRHNVAARHPMLAADLYRHVTWFRTSRSSHQRGTFLNKRCVGTVFALIRGSYIGTTHQRDLVAVTQTQPRFVSSDTSKRLYKSG